MILVELARLFSLTSFFTILAIAIALLFTRNFTKRELAGYWVFIQAKLLAIYCVVLPIYLAHFSSYDGRVNFAGATRFDRLSSLADFVHFKNANNVAAVGATTGFFRIFLGLDQGESHFISVAIGLAGALIFIKTLHAAYPLLSMRALNALFLLYPSIFLFTGLLLKDPFTFLFISILFHLTFRVSRNGLSINTAVLIAASLLCLSAYRLYSSLILGMAILAFGARSYVPQVKRPQRALFVLAFSAGAGVVGWTVVKAVWPRVFPHTPISLSGALIKLSETQRLLSSGGSRFELFQIHEAQDLILLPLNMLIVYLKPYPWEITNSSTLFAAFENLLTLAIGVYLVRHWRALATVIRFDRAASLSFVYVITFLACFSFFVGNAGTVFRQKVMFLPFYFHLALAVRHYQKEKRILAFRSPHLTGRALM